MSRPVLHVVTVSTRPGRSGPKVAGWFLGEAARHGVFDARPVDLAEVALPLFDEPRHPRLGQYEHAHTKAWSTLVKQADAFVFVTPEYNYTAPATLVNAFTYLLKEWGYAPAGFVSYGGLAGGARGVQSARTLAAAMRMVPVPEAVALPMFARQVDADGVFVGDEHQQKSAAALLDELARWTTALAGLRAGVRQ